MAEKLVGVAVSGAEDPGHTADDRTGRGAGHPRGLDDDRRGASGQHHGLCSIGRADRAHQAGDFHRADVPDGTRW